MTLPTLWARKRSLVGRLTGNAYSEHDLLRMEPQYAWLFLFHGNGYVRQTALDTISAPPRSPFFLAGLIWRLNDWVLPVRQAAKRCFERILSLIDPGFAADAVVALLTRSQSWGRWTEEKQIFFAVLARDDVAAELAKRLRLSVRGKLAACLRIALRHPSIDKHLPTLADRAIEPAVRALALRCLIARSATWVAGYSWIWVDKIYGQRRRVLTFDSRPLAIASDPEKWIANGVRDRSSAVRWVAAGELMRLQPAIPDADQLIDRLARDRSPSIDRKSVV